ncbi:MAG: hypothetical protein MR384_13210 [Lachnospiraceae bacterium]|nr:hypothetical protein [Lachnospiraceae bacterium]
MELTEAEQRQIKVQQALFELKVMGDKFSKENVQIVYDYITYLESKIERLENE